MTPPLYLDVNALTDEQIDEIMHTCHGPDLGWKVPFDIAEFRLLLAGLANQQAQARPEKEEPHER